MLFFCKYCTYSANRSFNVRVHEGRKHKNEQTNEAQQEYMINHLQNSYSQMRNESQNHQFGKQRVVKDVMSSPIHQNQQFGKGYTMQGAFDIRLKENFKLFISGPSRCGKTVFVSKLTTYPCHF